MEGRARARPNETRLKSLVAGDQHLQWRAGHVPGQTINKAEPEIVDLDGLQWRAGHVPGQTRSRVQGDAPGRGPSMEGRARARPNNVNPEEVPR